MASFFDQPVVTTDNIIGGQWQWSPNQKVNIIVSECAFVNHAICRKNECFRIESQNFNYTLEFWWQHSAANRSHLTDDRTGSVEKLKTASESKRTLN